MNEKICWLCGGEIDESIIQKLGTPIEKLGLSTVAKHCLLRSNVETIEELVKFKFDDLLNLRNIGIKTQNEIK